MYDYDPYLNDYSMFGAIDAPEATLISAVLTVYAVCIAVALLVGIACYVMNGIALCRMAKRTGVKRGWLGFIPFANNWLLGRLSDVGSSRRHSGARILGFEIAAECCAVGCIGTAVSLLVNLFSSGLLDGTVSDDAVLSLLMPHLATTGILAVVMMAFLICTAVFQCMALYRIGVNFGSSGFGLALVLTAFFCTLATYIILLVLSGKTPKCTEGEPVAAAPQSDAPTDSVFQ